MIQINGTKRWNFASTTIQEKEDDGKDLFGIDTNLISMELLGWDIGR
jgi:hypothetical protein